MTAEIGVMNAVGIALAADSAVTVGRNADKIYTSADKLFQLSDFAPVAIMVYGSAHFVGIPWETAIKSYRVELADKKYGTVAEYAEGFLKWLGTNRMMFPVGARQDSITRILYFFYHHLQQDRIRKRLDDEFRERAAISDSELPPILDDVVGEMLNELKGAPLLRDLPTNTRSRFRRAFSSVLSETITEFFGDLPFTPSARRKLKTLASEVVTREFFGPSRSGVVVAGFGEDQYTPALVSYNLEEMLFERPRAARVHSLSVERPDDGQIIPFAQSDMVHTFMEGVDENVGRGLANQTSQLFKGTVDAIIERVSVADPALADSIRGVVQAQTEGALRSLFNEWLKLRQRHWAPILQVVASLPKDELAEMAEALVNLTKFRRRVSIEPETVGGPIDVAVITRGDGFVWVRRKHYFDPSLNPRFMARMTPHHRH